MLSCFDQLIPNSLAMRAIRHGENQDEVQFSIALGQISKNNSNLRDQKSDRVQDIETDR